MAISVNNNMGSISIAEAVIAKAVRNEVVKCAGVWGLAEKEGIGKLLKKSSYYDGIEIEKEKDGSINMDIHIIVCYGANVKSVGETVYNCACERLKNDLGDYPFNVSVIIEAVKSEGDE